MRLRRSSLGRHGSFLLATIAILSPVDAYAERLSRGAAIAKALVGNPQIASVAAGVAFEEARRDQVAAARYPSVAVTAGIGPSLQASLAPGSAINSTRNAYGDVRLRDLSVVLAATVSIIQPLYTFGKIDERAEAAEHSRNARSHQTDMKRAEVAFETAQLYESLLFAREATRFFQEMQHGLTSTIENTKVEVEAGRMTESDILRLRAARGLLSLGQNQAKAGVAQATAGLIAYLSLPVGSAVEPEEPHLAELAFSAPDAKRLAVTARSQRPELFALREGRVAYERLAAAEQAGNLPDFFIAAFASAAYTPGRDLVDTRFAYDPLNHFVPGGFAGARWQLQGGTADALAAQARAQAIELQHLERWADAGIPAEIRVALESIERAKRDIEATKEATADAKKWAVHAAADFSFGLGSSREVEDATTAYVTLRLALLRARFEHNVALASLAKATGCFTSPSTPFSPYPVKAPSP